LCTLNDQNKNVLFNPLKPTLCTLNDQHDQNLTEKNILKNSCCLIDHFSASKMPSSLKLKTPTFRSFLDYFYKVNITFCIVLVTFQNEHLLD